MLVDWGAVTPFDSSFGQQKGLIWAWVMRMLAFSSLSSSFSLAWLVMGVDDQVRIVGMVASMVCRAGTLAQYHWHLPFPPQISGSTYSEAEKVSVKHVRSDFRLLGLLFSPSLVSKPIFCSGAFTLTKSLTHFPSLGLSKQGGLIVKFGSITVVDDRVPLIMPERRVSVEPLFRNACTGITIPCLQTFWLRPRQTILSAQSAQVRKLGHAPDGIVVVYYRRLALGPLSSASIRIYV